MLTAAGQLLKPADATGENGGYYFLYGPFKRHGTFNAESNEKFDQSLRNRNSTWGVRDTDDLEKVAESAGLKLRKLRDAPITIMICAH